MIALSKIHLNQITEEDLKEYTLSDKRNLYVVTKNYPYHSRSPHYLKGDELRVTRIRNGNIAEVTLPDGEPLGVDIPLENLKKIQKESKLTEALRAKDLKSLVDDTMTIDEFKSKMGDDEDVIVVSFFISGREASEDLNNFIEKGYSFILDADVSPGEMDNGKYVVFVEFDRTKKFPKELIQILKDLTKLTSIKRWHFKYFKFKNKQEAITDNLIKLPLSKEDYLLMAKIKNPEYHDPHNPDHRPHNETLESIEPQLNAMRAIAGIPITHHKPKITDPKLIAMQRIAHIPGK